MIKKRNSRSKYSYYKMMIENTISKGSKNRQINSSLSMMRSLKNKSKKKKNDELPLNSEEVVWLLVLLNDRDNLHDTEEDDE